MKYFLLLFLFFSCCGITLNAQNLIPNPSFEDTVHNSNGQPILKGWENNIGSPDYFSSLKRSGDNQTPKNNRGTQVPYNGQSYLGFGTFDLRLPNEREYLQIELLDTLTKGEKYEVEFYLSLADTFHLALSDRDLGIAFKKEVQPNNFDNKVREFRPYFISDSAWNGSNKNGWEKFHYTYTADGGEKVLIIGCFLPDDSLTVDSVGNGGNNPFWINTSYYFIDQVSVQLKDTSTSLNETVFLNAAELYPNPAKEYLQFRYSGKEPLQFELFSAQGRKLSIKANMNHHYYHFDTAALSPGLYFLLVSDGKQQKTFKFLKQ